MFNGIQTNNCGTTWFMRNREESAPPLGPRPTMSMEAPADGPTECVHLSSPEDAPAPTLVKLPRDPFQPPVNPGLQVIKAARTLVGRDTCGIVGQLQGLNGTADGNNMCADFATAMLRKFGRLKGHYMSVPLLQAGLPKEGWKRIPANQARPGDLAITYNGGHAELVATNGGTRLIGSNNWGRTVQSIREHDQDPSQAIFWGRR